MPSSTRSDSPPDLPGDREALRSLAADAKSCLPCERRTIAIGSVRVAIEMIGRAVIDRVWPALAAGEVDTDPACTADIVLTAWDMAAARQLLPSLSMLPDAGRADRQHGRPVERDDGGDRILAWFQPIESVISLYDTSEQRGWYCVRDGATLPPWETAAPLRALLRWALAPHGLHLMHAACVGQPDRSVVFAGRGGSGKSTTTALCALGGLVTVGDDYIVIDPDHLVAHALYRTVKLDSALVARHEPFHRVPSEHAAHDKRRIWLDDLASACLASALPISAVAVAYVGTEPSTMFTHAPPPEVVKALVPSTVLQTPGTAHATLDAAIALASDSACFRARFGRDLTQVVTSVARFIDSLPPAGCPA